MSDESGSTHGFRSLTWPRFLSAPDPDLLEKLYVPGLGRALRYDRSCAYFSSQVLAVAARGFGGLIHNLLHAANPPEKPAVRLLVNEQMDRKDVEHLLTTHDQTPLIETLLKHFKNPTEALEKNRLQMLTWLVASGWLEVRVGLMARTSGVMHAKFGILTDTAGDQIAFMGSDNETGSAIIENAEELTLGTSWGDPDFVQYYRQRFETLWQGQDPHVEVLPLPDAVRQRLVKLAPARPPAELRSDPKSVRAAMLWHYLQAAPYLHNGASACDATALVTPWPHQVRVVEDAAQAFPAGRLLCDEVGMGKTVEAILVLRRLLNGRGVQRALLLLPAGLLKQWQDELREKGALLVPRWEDGYLIQPDGRKAKMEAQEALAQNPLLLISREWARLANNRSFLLNAPAWDLVLLDEAHAARRKEQKETEFNSGNLLLELLRDLQLHRQARGLLLLSATPMQTQPWEPWDLLSTLGIGGGWLVQFDDLRRYYQGIQCLQGGDLDLGLAQHMARLIVCDEEFPPPPGGSPWPLSVDELTNHLTFALDSERPALARWLRQGAPLGRRMHRNTRQTLRRYYDLGLLSARPPERLVRDIVFDYQVEAERACYEAIKAYIDERYKQLEKERTGKGFVMTIYRRRASSSPLALRRSLERRLEKVERVANRQAYDPLRLADEQIDISDFADEDMEEAVDPGLPTSIDAAKAERLKIEELLGKLDQLGRQDSKQEKFWEMLEQATADGRPVLVFTEYADTLEYLRQELQPKYQTTLACYSGRGGELFDGKAWHEAPKSEITERLEKRQVKILLCTDAASEGLNLQAAGALINYDLPWNPSRVEQRIGRIDRIGQQNQKLPVFNLFLTNSIDVNVYRVLRERCGLFEHFVGRMQPVLALARNALRRILSPEEAQKILVELGKTASQVDQDEAVQAAFDDAEAEKSAAAQPAATLVDLANALAALQKADGKLRVKSTGPDQWEIRGLKNKAIKLTTSRATLEGERDQQPLSLGCEVIRLISEALPLPSRAPLVIAERSAGPYRVAEVFWVQGETILPVGSAAQLTGLLESWDGAPASPNLLLKAQRQAGQALDARLLQMQTAAAQAERLGLQRQQDAATLRLRRELGRTLACTDPHNLDAAFRKLVQSEPPDGRYHKALKHLGGYPEWNVEEQQACRAYALGLNEDQRKGRVRLGSEVDAALNDPRW